MLAYSYDSKGYFTKERKCQIDPLESKAAGKDIWLLPANSTFKEPLPAKEGFKVKFENDNWVYEEVVKEPEPEPYMPTIEEKQSQVRSQRDYMLQKTDFTQLGDAPLSEQEKALYVNYRQYLRDYTKLDNWYEQTPLEFNEWNK